MGLIKKYYVSHLKTSSTNIDKLGINKKFHDLLGRLNPFYCQS